MTTSKADASKAGCLLGKGSTSKSGEECGRQRPRSGQEKTSQEAQEIGERHSLIDASHSVALAGVWSGALRARRCLGGIRTPNLLIRSQML
jgi:hypothetical protein